MNKVLSKTAYTLLELIIALVLVTVVVLGIFAVNSVLSNNNQDYGQRYLVRSDTQTTLNHIINNASLAVGSATTLTPSGGPPVADLGILIGAQMGAANNNSFCIHQNNGADTWLCYVFDPVGFQIKYCNKAYNLTDPNGYRGAGGSCLAAAQFLGTAFSIATVFTNSNGQLLFTITIQNCLNDSATCFSAPDPVNNPNVTVSGSAFPTQVSM